MMTPADTTSAPSGLERLQRILHWLRPRPAEWVVLAFYLFLWLSPSAPQDSKVQALPRLEILIGSLELFMVRQVVRWFRTPWAQPASPLAVLYPASLMVVLIPLASVFFDSLAHVPDAFPLDSQNGGAGAAIKELVVMVLDRTMVGALPLLLWLSLGLHAKPRGGLALGSFAVQGTVAALDYVRDAGALVLIIFGYSHMSDVLAHPFTADQDPLMRDIGRALFLGVQPELAIQHLSTPWFNEWMTLAYVLYPVLIAVTWGGLLASGTRRSVTEFAFAACATMATGYMIYPLVPVTGPMFNETYTVDLNAWIFGWVKEQLNDPFRVQRDCFPSLHTGFSMVMLLTARRHVRWLAWVLAPVVLSIPVACVYLRFHYVADVLAGLALAFFVNEVVRRVYPPERAATG